MCIHFHLGLLLIPDCTVYYIVENPQITAGRHSGSHDTLNKETKKINQFLERALGNPLCSGHSTVNNHSFLMIFMNRYYM